MHRPFTMALEGLLRIRCRLRYSEPRELAASHLGPGGVEEAERLCEEANRDLLAFLRPPRQTKLERFRREGEVAAEHAFRAEHFTFRSPRASGCPHNDIVPCRLYLPKQSESPGSVVVFHHSMRQDSWEFWEGFLRSVMARVPVAIMAAPHHFSRRRPGEFPGQRTCSSNPWELFEALRQWSWDQQSLQRALVEHYGLRPRSIVGFSLGAFQTLLLAAAGALDGMPLVAMAPTCRYAHGIRHGWVGGNIMRQLREVGIDYERLCHMTRSLQLNRFGSLMKGERVLFVEGLYDRVDPPPSIPLLREALRPRQTLSLPCGHGSMVLWRLDVSAAMDAFFEDMDVLPRTQPGESLAMAPESGAGPSR